MHYLLSLQQNQFIIKKRYNMKRLSLAIILACCTLVLAAQESIRVNYKGASPTISDLAWAFLSDYVYDENEDVLDEARSGAKYVWTLYRKGKPLPEHATITVDQRNGYACYESKDEDWLVRIEMCYWNEADKKHKLFAYNVTCFDNGKCSPGQFDGLEFYRYTNATKTMVPCDDPGFNTRYGTDDGDGVAYISYDLPRTGKDIIENIWYESGKQQNILKWNGRRFSY